MEKALKKSSAEAPTSALQTGEPKRRGVKDALEWVMHLIFMLCGIIAVAFVLFISIYLIISGVPAIREIGLVDFLFGQEWSPTASDPSFGILPFILTSVYGTAGAILIGVPIGLMTAVFLAKVANPKVAAVIHTAVELLAGIPSVVYGLVGMILLVPAIRVAFDLPSGATLLAAIIVLAVMILPSIVSVSETALRAVPREYEEASLALGATHIETVFRVSVPAARSGIATKRQLAPANCVGVIDADYRGELRVFLQNNGTETQTVENGERIAQLVITPCLDIEIEETDELSETLRGASGFGSTGTH